MRPKLSRSVDDLGPTLPRVVQGSSDRVAGGPTMADPVDDVAVEQEGLVLGIGVPDPAVAAALLERLDGTGAGAVLLKAPLAAAPELLSAAAAADITVVEVSRGAGQLYTLLRRLLEPLEIGLSDDGSDDLFQLANEICALVEAPVTIENGTGGVLAFSSGQEEHRLPRAAGPRCLLRALQLLRELPEHVQVPQ